MTVRRHPTAKRPLPELPAAPAGRSSREAPHVSGEYRLVGDVAPGAAGPKAPSRSASAAVRPRIRPISTAKMAEVDVHTHAPPAPVHRDVTRDMTKEPRRYETVQMRALEPSRSSGADFDFDIDADGALDLDCLPSSQNTREEVRWHSTPEVPSARMGTGPRHESPTGRAVRRDSTTAPALAVHRPSTTTQHVTSSAAMRSTASGQILPPAPSFPVNIPGRRSSQSVAAADPHSALLAFSGFGDAPRGLWAAPAYALRVIVRRKALLQDLAAARARHSPDVGLYEASLCTADDDAVRRGVIVMFAVALGIVAGFAGIAYLLLATVRVAG